MRYLQTKENARESLDGELFLDAVSSVGMWLDDVTFNQEVSGE